MIAVAVLTLTPAKLMTVIKIMIRMAIIIYSHRYEYDID